MGSENRYRRTSKRTAERLFQRNCQEIISKIYTLVEFYLDSAEVREAALFLLYLVLALKELQRLIKFFCPENFMRIQNTRIFFNEFITPLKKAQALIAEITEVVAMEVNQHDLLASCIVLGVRWDLFSKISFDLIRLNASFFEKVS